MQSNHPSLGQKFRKSLELAQTRLVKVEDEAHKMVEDVVKRSKAPRQEVAAIVARINAGELFDPKTIKQWQGKARHVSDDLAHKVADLRSRAIAYAGVASRDQVEELACDLDRLSRKIDRLVAKKKQ
jgi:polyhydroxyalkanoate synthesis regulator phasin